MLADAPGTAAATADGVEILGGASVVEGAGVDAVETLEGPGDGEASAWAEVEPAGGAWPRAGPVTFVERWMMSLPCTAIVSFDFLSSRVKVSAVACAGGSAREASARDLEQERTIAAEIEVHRGRDGDVDDTQEALVLLLELLLVEDLNRQDARVFNIHVE